MRGRVRATRPVVPGGAWSSETTVTLTGERWAQQRELILALTIAAAQISRAANRDTNVRKMRCLALELDRAFGLVPELPRWAKP